MTNEANRRNAWVHTMCTKDEWKSTSRRCSVIFALAPNDRMSKHIYTSTHERRHRFNSTPESFIQQLKNAQDEMWSKSLIFISKIYYIHFWSFLAHSDNVCKQSHFVPICRRSFHFTKEKSKIFVCFAVVYSIFTHLYFVVWCFAIAKLWCHRHFFLLL